MDADLDSLCTAVYVTADDLLPSRPGNGRRRVTDAELVTLALAQAVMGIPSDRRFLAVAPIRLAHLFPRIPGQSGYHKRRQRLAETIDWLAGSFAAASPGYGDDLVLLDSTPLECGRSIQPASWCASSRRVGALCPSGPAIARRAGAPSLALRALHAIECVHCTHLRGKGLP